MARVMDMVVIIILRVLGGWVVVMVMGVDGNVVLIMLPRAVHRMELTVRNPRFAVDFDPNPIGSEASISYACPIRSESYFK